MKIFQNWLKKPSVNSETPIASDDFDNDAHSYSTPPAGYVGAQMIYRSLFNKMPPKIDDSYFFWFDSYLIDDYIKTGYIDFSSECGVYRF